MENVNQLARYCNQLLETHLFKDYAPNGLQVEGTRPVKHIVTGVTASAALIDEAIERGADTILVHHGYFWKGEDPVLVGMKGDRIRKLMQHDISLLGYHLPLDAHPIYGNNAGLGEKLGIQNISVAGVGHAKNILFHGELTAPVSGEAFAAHVGEALNRAPLHIPGNAAQIKQVAWCTGGAQGFIDQAANLGVDAYISGEISEKTTHEAKELGVHYFAAGHHATERYGVIRLGDHLQETFGVTVSHVDIDNPA